MFSILYGILILNVFIFFRNRLAAILGFFDFFDSLVLIINDFLINSFWLNLFFNFIGHRYLNLNNYRLHKDYRVKANESFKFGDISKLNIKSLNLKPVSFSVISFLNFMNKSSMYLIEFRVYLSYIPKVFMSKGGKNRINFDYLD